MSVFVVSNCSLPNKDWELLFSVWSKVDSIVAIAVSQGKRGRVLFCNSEVSSILPFKPSCICQKLYIFV